MLGTITADTVSDTIDTNILIGDESIIKTLKVADLKKQLGMRNLTKQGNKSVLLERLLENIQTTTSTEPEPRNEDNTVMSATETVDTSHDTHPVRNGHTDTLEMANLDC